MARECITSYVKFKKVSGFTPGPLKPTVTAVTGSTDTIANTIGNNLTTDMANMTKGETINIVITVGDTIT